MPSSFTYHEPTTSTLLIIPSFLYLLNLVGWITQTLLSARLLGQILIGIVFGSPLAGWLGASSQDAGVGLGYFGLLVIVFEGGLSTDLPTLYSLLPISALIALTGILLPISLSFVLLPLTSSSPLHAFAAGSALASTSLGTTLSVLHPSTIGFDLKKTRLGTALLGAAIMDDVVAFVFAQILTVLGESTSSSSTSSSSGSVGANVGRTIGVTIGLGLVLIPLARWIFQPVYCLLRRYAERWDRRGRIGEESVLLGVMVLLFVGMIAAAGYAGTSPLYGAYIAGLTASYLSRSQDTISLRAGPSANDMVDFGVVAYPPLARSKTLPAASTRLSSCTAMGKLITPTPTPTRPPQPTFESTYAHLLSPLVDLLLLPVFFASIGYSIPFLQLWRGRIIWRGVVYALLMTVGKVLCGSLVILWSPSRPSDQIGTGMAKAGVGRTRRERNWKGGMLLGFAMIARGEIGLLISQIAYHTPTPLLTEDEFLVVTWGILLCTVIGPVGVGFFVKRWGRGILAAGWD